MKSILTFIISLFFFTGAYPQDTLSLKSCLISGNDRNLTLRGARIRDVQAELTLRELKGKCWPEISLAYDYKYNPVIATTVIPVGQFNIDNPSNVLRGIKMGSNWQQNAGVSISQPLIDFSITRSLRKSRIERQQARLDYRIKREELMSEICLTYLNICRDEQLLATGSADTLRTWSLLSELELRFSQQRVLLSELNKARINHNQAVTWFEDRLAEMVVEKIYLAYLTGMSTDSLVFVNKFDYAGAGLLLQSVMDSHTDGDSLLSVERVHLDENLAREELREAKSRSMPKVSFDGFLGADQYSDKFEPAANNSWFGNIYVGLSLRLPILYGENIQARNKRLKLKAETFAVEAEQEKRRLEMLGNQNLIRIDNIEKDVKSIAGNAELQRESIYVLRRRFEEQQITAYQLNQEMAELLKLQSSLLERFTELNQETLQYVKNRGLLRYLFINDVIR